ncbi:TPA: hypothetical protein ACKRTE_001445 [Providencia rettgeri]
MGLNLIGHQIYNAVRNNRAEIASGAALLPVYAGIVTIGVAAALMGINTEQSGCGDRVPLLKTKNKCATSAKVIKAIENPTETNVSKAFASQLTKIHQLGLGDQRTGKYETRLSDIYTSYIKEAFPEAKQIKSPISFSISPHHNTVRAYFNKEMDEKVIEKVKHKLINDHNAAANRVRLRFDF